MWTNRINLWFNYRNLIIECDIDIFNITKNLDFKTDTLKNVKDHVFYNEHNLDHYSSNVIEQKRFDAPLEQAFAYKRLETVTHTENDVTWKKHECAKWYHKLRYVWGYITL